MGICKANLEYHDFMFACCRKGRRREREREGKREETQTMQYKTHEKNSG
jgi:hypothetical protein